MTPQVLRFYRVRLRPGRRAVVSVCSSSAIGRLVPGGGHRRDPLPRAWRPEPPL